jgi:wyosine [tRNA(Phe)-imidazoG37] synthetase (radical SAM superfamily)
MSTFLFDKTIFGPVKSRRLGVSLGINLLPNTRKLCNFNCIYCECGWNPENKEQEQLPTVKEVERLLDEKLSNMKEHNEPLDVITFAGNGEPTMHPQFAEIIDITLAVRDKYFPKVKVAVLSNSSLVYKKEVFDALNKVDRNILKIDSAFAETCILINNPTGYFNIDELIDNLGKFKGNLIIQTMFVTGKYNGKPVDNTTEHEVNAWVEVIKKVKPAEVMIYTIARETPVHGLNKVPLKKLNEIASIIRGLGFNISVSE